MKESVVADRSFRENESLSIFLRQMEALKQILRDKAVLILDPQMLPSLGWLRQGPPADATGAEKTPETK